ncbi:MAG: PleD family two-component system response regulator [Roseovarius sp.]
MRILTVDDEPIFCDLLRTRLEQLGYREIRAAHTGQEALEIAEESTDPIECFIVDIRMMPMDGIELVRHLRRIPHHTATPIVMLSALTDKSSIDAAFMAGANDYVTKPLELVELKIRLEMARNILAERAQARLLHEHVLRQEAILFPSASFDGEIILDDVEGAVSRLSMENFLLKQGNMRLRQCSALGFHLPMAETYFRMMDPTYYAVLIGDMAQAVSNALSAYPHMLCCPGDGDIVAVLIDKPHADRTLISENLAHELEGLRHRFDAIDMTLPEVRVGDPVRVGLFRMQCPTTLIDRARRAAGGPDRVEDQRQMKAIA